MLCLLAAKAGNLETWGRRWKTRTGRTRYTAHSWGRGGAKMARGLIFCLMPISSGLYGASSPLMKLSDLMRQMLHAFFALLLACGADSLYAQTTQVVDVPTRPGVTQRFIYIEPVNAKASVVL